MVIDLVVPGWPRVRLLSGLIGTAVVGLCFLPLTGHAIEELRHPPSVSSQGWDGGPGGFGPGGFGPGAFGGPPQPGQILPSSVRDMLQLTDEQKKQLDELQNEADRKLQELLTGEQKRQFKEMQENFGPPGFGGFRGFGGPGFGGGGPPGGEGGWPGQPGGEIPR